MGSDIERRLNRIEGLLTKLLIDSKVSEKTADKAISLAQAALIEIKAYKESTHEVKYLRSEEYDAAFNGKRPEPEPVEGGYGPDTTLKVMDEFDTNELSPFDLHDSYEVPEVASDKKTPSIEESN